jgi:hypothetical protein
MTSLSLHERSQAGFQQANVSSGEPLYAARDKRYTVHPAMKKG